jgi:hypothetical protein
MRVGFLRADVGHASGSQLKGPASAKSYKEAALEIFPVPRCGLGGRETINVLRSTFVGFEPS